MAPNLLKDIIMEYASDVVNKYNLSLRMDKTPEGHRFLMIACDNGDNAATLNLNLVMIIRKNKTWVPHLIDLTSPNGNEIKQLLEEAVENVIEELKNKI